MTDIITYSIVVFDVTLADGDEAHIVIFEFKVTFSRIGEFERTDG